MKTMRMTKTLVGSLAVFLALGTLAESPTISDVVVRQRWPWNRLVDIEYVLACDAGQEVDIEVTAYDGATVLGLPLASLTGDLHCVSNGARRIVWDPMKTGYTNAILPRFHVDLSPTNTPVYLIVDLTKNAGATNQIERIYPGDARLDTVGRWTNVWFGVTNGSVYKTEKVVLRRVPACTFKMGPYPPAYSITLTKDFYAGVFEVTEAQWNKIMGDGSSVSDYPIANVSYDMIRGATNDVPSVNWYTTGSAVGATNFMGRIRTKTGIDTFGLPTEAQWECLCRAGTLSYWSDGVSTSATETNILNELGWWGGGYNGNSGNKTHPVGRLAANNWGLYDTHGNVWERCLDWYGSLASTTDPLGALYSSSGRTIRGGSFDFTAAGAASGTRYGDTVNTSVSMKGFRLVMTLP